MKSEGYLLTGIIISLFPGWKDEKVFVLLMMLLLLGFFFFFSLNTCSTQKKNGMDNSRRQELVTRQIHIDAVCNSD